MRHILTAARRPAAVQGLAQEAQSLEGSLRIAPASPAHAPARKVSLRPYQEDCIKKCLEALQQGHSRIGISSPTGSGKTTIFTSLIERLPRLQTLCEGSDELGSDTGHRVLILVSSIELALQAAKTVSSFYPDLLVEIEQGSKFKASGVADVTIATVQTLSRVGSGEERLQKFDPQQFKAVIVDEAHHAAAKSYIRVLSHFDPTINGQVEQEARGDKNCFRVPILGFSATFSRHDGLALGSVFQRIVFHKDFLEMIGEGWLSPLRFTVIRAKIDLSGVKLMSGSSGGDFQTSSLANYINTSEINRLIVRTWLDRCANTDPAAANQLRRSTLVFCVNIDHVNNLTDKFRAAGIDARSLTGETPVRERAELLRSFRAMEFPVLINCSILAEGADVPSIDCVLLARPTRSRNLFSQMIGRAARLSPSTGKKDALVLDLVGNVERGDGIVCTPSLFGLSADVMIEDETIESLGARAQEAIAAAAPGPSPAEETDNLLSVSSLSYIDYDDPRELQAMLTRPGRAPLIERLSRNAWIDCGHDIFVLDIPRYGHIKVERTSEAERMELDAKWKSTYTPANLDPDEQAALSGLPGVSRGWPFSRGRRKGSPYRRGRNVLYENDLDNAIRGSDTYATTRILHSSPFNALLDRRAAWRSKPASESQKALVERRLGFHRAPVRKTEEKSVGEHSGDTDGQPKLENLSRGMASIILTRLNHGTKGRWTEEAKRQNRIFNAEAAEAARKERETLRWAIS
ncbi:ResIII-domain-containing protein [Tilletiaria anomala UBC 951]|uniref:ResIII-domain-containing protein n=1 Tax=Tilletiaria anomala (strain ATCC 24038 / CBS 436.72 / UBC 951) TaxID=1037660 RepID=A0A066W191_TILAU|nr:ResIII-domain-containing protein [Tilletiaria anomala UBC 951]KDN47737.1 ResIII-domain-containing protein [Tilletiaria anomala UBC 951]